MAAGRAKIAQETILRRAQNNIAAAKPFSAFDESTLPQNAGKPLPIAATTEWIAPPGEGSLPPHRNAKEGNSR